MKYHKYADFFPLMNDEQLAELALDIKTNGLLEPIWTYEDAILDGRNRYLACEKVGVKPRFEEYKGDSPIAFVVSLNLMRRQLTHVQRTVVAVEIYEPLQNEARKRMATSGPGSYGGKPGKATMPEAVGQARDQAGAIAGVSGKSVDMGRTIKSKAPELMPLMQRSELPVSQAFEIAEKLNTESRRLRAAKRVIEEQATVEQTRKIINEIAGRKPEPAPQKQHGAAVQVEEGYRLISVNATNIDNKELHKKWLKKAKSMVQLHERLGNE
mgnify:CR=1 FL=1